jgi:phosphoenolpyruvate synthase/pyruvate phosphate dikinase
LADIIATRQAQHAAWAQLEPPPLLGVPDAKLPERPPWQNELTTETSEETTAETSTGLGRIAGQAASPGRHRGRARVVRDLTPLPVLAPGDVLVAENAGPLWTPFFPRLGGLVLDGGSLMQHAATTAREYGVPAVIGTRNATQHIPDGAWVTVDGTEGMVEIEPWLEIEPER